MKTSNHFSFAAVVDDLKQQDRQRKTEYLQESMKSQFHDLVMANVKELAKRPGRERENGKLPVDPNGKIVYRDNIQNIGKEGYDDFPVPIPFEYSTDNPDCFMPIHKSALRLVIADVFAEARRKNKNLRHAA